MNNWRFWDWLAYAGIWIGVVVLTVHRLWEVSDIVALWEGVEPKASKRGSI
jgi:hypothetical protein